ncbi:MAG: hypothetical protein MZU91_15195 [Desulfosudis oleivorans]|nr:hypothetical protein [Desulfosudis oleivorans]
MPQVAEKILSPSDIEHIRARGTTQEKVLRQIDLCSTWGGDRDPRAAGDGRRRDHPGR